MYRQHPQACALSSGACHAFRHAALSMRRAACSPRRARALLVTGHSVSNIKFTPLPTALFGIALGFVGFCLLFALLWSMILTKKVRAWGVCVLCVLYIFKFDSQHIRIRKVSGIFDPRF